MLSITALHWVTLISVLFWLVLYWQGGRKILVDIQTALRTHNSRLDTALLMLISLCSLVLVVTITLATLGQPLIGFPQDLAMMLAGTLLVLFGIFGMFYCRHYLGRFWTAEINLSSTHQVVDTGPYRFVRHPIYTSALCMYLGVGLVFPSFWSGLFVGVIVAAYIVKAKDEDAFLEKNLSGYREYKSRVRFHLVPGLW